MVQLEFSWSDGHCASSPVASLRSDLTDAATCRPSASGPLLGFWGPNPRNPPRVAYSIRFSATRHVSPSSLTGWPSKSFWASLDSHVRHLDLVNTVTPMYTCACRCSRCQPLRLVTRPSGPSVQASRPPFTALGLSVRHVSTWPSSRRRPLPSSSISNQETCHTHSFRHGNVSHQLNLFVDHVDNHSSQNEPQGYFSTLCSHYHSYRKGHHYPN